jgi:hypothetical protein
MWDKVSLITQPETSNAETDLLLWYTHLNIWLFKAILFQKGHVRARTKMSGALILNSCKALITFSI